MKLTLDEMREIAKRLPIGYYLGRKTPIFIEEDDRAYCDIIKGDIHIGIGLLQKAADHINPADAHKWDREALLRCLLYHEISHLLLTPKEFHKLSLVNPRTASKFSPQKQDTIYNIFEDERIEQTLASTFMGVDFKAFVHLVSGSNSNLKKTKKKNSDELIELFDAIRLRDTTTEISNLIDEAIQELSYIHYFYYDHHLYKEKLQMIINKILEKEEEKDENDDKNDDEQEEENSEGNGGNDENKDGDDGDEGDESDESNTDGEDNTSQGNQDEGDGDEENEDECENNEDEGSNKESSGKKYQTPKKIITPYNLKDFCKARFTEPTTEATNALNRFATRLAKKRGTVAAGCWSGLHGRIETKRDAMDKDKIFRRKSDVGERIMSSINLTLWVDHSGSFFGSKDILNKILTAASRAMNMSHGKLNINVIKMDWEAEVASPSEWAVNPSGGNGIDTTYLSAWRKTRKKEFRNIDIVVFDGVCCDAANNFNSAKFFESLKSNEKQNQETANECRVRARAGDDYGIAAKIWNSPDCWILSDVENETFFNEVAPKSHRTFMETGYANALQAKVIEILDRVL